MLAGMWGIDLRKKKGAHDVDHIAHHPDPLARGSPADLAVQPVLGLLSCGGSGSRPHGPAHSGSAWPRLKTPPGDISRNLSSGR